MLSRGFAVALSVVLGIVLSYLYKIGLRFSYLYNTKRSITFSLFSFPTISQRLTAAANPSVLLQALTCQVFRYFFPINRPVGFGSVQRTSAPRFRYQVGTCPAELSRIRQAPATLCRRSHVPARFGFNPNFFLLPGYFFQQRLLTTQATVAAISVPLSYPSLGSFANKCTAAPSLMLLNFPISPSGR